VNDRAVRAALALVAAVGVLLAAYLTWVHYDEGALVCTPGGGCETVQQSDYAEIGGVPVAALGVVYYSVVLALVVWDSTAARTACAALGVAGLAFALYLVALQLLVIDATCVWCMVNDLALAPLLALLALARVRHATTSGPGAGASA
jgi:uncharacterized membrane protein